jgi:hypothetical protein
MRLYLIEVMIQVGEELVHRLRLTGVKVQVGRSWYRGWSTQRPGLRQVVAGFATGPHGGYGSGRKELVERLKVTKTMAGPHGGHGSGREELV